VTPQADLVDEMMYLTARFLQGLDVDAIEQPGIVRAADEIMDMVKVQPSPTRQSLLDAVARRL